MTDDLSSTLDSFLIRIGALEQERDVLRQRLKELRAIVNIIVEDSGGCDHSVGICYCEWIAALERADSAIGGGR